LAVVAEPTMRASEALVGLFKVAAEIEGTGVLAIAEALSSVRAGAADHDSLDDVAIESFSRRFPRLTAGGWYIF
jgi:hypothetical protein